MLSGTEVQGYRQSYSNGSMRDTSVHEMTLLTLAMPYNACLPTLHSLTYAGAIEGMQPCEHILR
jgi:hypothetical protein